MTDDGLRAWAAETEARMAAEAEVRRLTASVARLRAERDAITRLCYRPVVTAEEPTYYRLVLETVDRQERDRPTEAAAARAVRRAAGLEEEAPR
jgi:hypothetical protein